MCFYILGELGFDRVLNLDPDLLLLFNFLFKELQTSAALLPKCTFFTGTKLCRRSSEPHKAVCN